jgi:TnpA family transposase
MKVGKQSEVLGALDIPLDIVKSIVSLPTELIQFKMNYSSENKKLYDALLEEIQAKDALIDYLQERETKGKAQGR